MNTYKKLSIAVDMGAKNNGVFIAKSDGKNIENTKSSCIIIDGNKISFSKKDRRENRHKDRNYKRRKLAKRLLSELIYTSKYENKEQELINGLLNNRGYTFLSVASEFEKLEDETINFISLYIKDIVKLKTKNEFDIKLDEFDDNQALLDFLETLIDDITLNISNLNIFTNKSKILQDIDSLENKKLKEFKSFSIYTRNLLYRYKIKYEYKDNDEIKEKYISLDKQDIALIKIQEDYSIVSSIDFNKERKGLNNLNYNDKSVKNSKIINNDLKLLKEFLLGIQKEINTGSKPRKQYLKDIKNEIKSFNFIKDFSDIEFFNLIGNISNLQLRVLRKLFNENSKNKTKFNILKEYFIAFHYKSDIEKEIRKNLFKEMDKYNDLNEFLKNSNPIHTIPPYEDMNNRDTYKCNSMLINPSYLNENIKKAIDIVFDKEEFKLIRTKFNEKTGEFTKEDKEERIILKHKKLSKKELLEHNNTTNQAPIKYEKIDFTYSKYLQRILDIKMDNDNKPYHPRVVFKNKNPQAITTFKKLFKKDVYNALKDISTRYYEEEQQINNGIYEKNISLFIKCNTNTPYKNNAKHLLLKPIYSYNFEDKEADVFLDLIKESYGLQSALKRVSDEAKKYQNSFYHIIEACFNDANCVDDKEIKSIIKNIDKTLALLKTALGDKDTYIKNIKTVHSSNIKRVINIFKQTYEILFKELNGFNKTCQDCTKENATRSDENLVIGKRLLSDVAKPIDGMLDMMLDRLAYEIVENVDKSDMQDVGKLEILLEQNKFNFEEDLNTIKRASNSSIKKYKNEYKDRLNVNICPYSGKLFDKGDYDHILPQAKGVYNSKANMIYASVEGNQKIKGDKDWTLDMLKSEHLKQVFKTDNLQEIKTKIKDGLNTIKEFTNFDNLNFHQQIAFRYGLFMKDTNEFKKAFELLKQDKIKTFSNGTQKRLARLIYEKLIKKYPNEFKNIAVDSRIIDNILVSNTRRVLSHNKKELQKQDIQNSHSHCIDAMVVFHLANSKGSPLNKFESKGSKNERISKREFNFNFNDVYLEESSINNLTKNKRFINSQKKETGSYKLFDDTIYSEHYDNVNIDFKHLDILIKNNLIYQAIKNKKHFIQNKEEIDAEKVCKIDVKKTSDTIYKFFQDKNKPRLEELKFLDKLRYSTSRKEIENIFFDEKNTKLLDFNNIKGIPKDSTNLYKAVYKKLSNGKSLFNNINGKSTLVSETLIKLLVGLFESKQKQENKQTRKRGKKRHKFTLPMLGSPKFRINRNDTWQVLSNKDISTKNYIIDGEIVPVPFFSKNTIPLSVNDLIKCLLVDVDTPSIYNIKIDIKEIEQYVGELSYTITEAKRCIIKVSFKKNAFSDISFLDIVYLDGVKDEMFKKFLENHIENKDLKLSSFVGSIRDGLKGKAIILDNNKNEITLQYVAGINKNKKQIILKNIKIK